MLVLDGSVNAVRSGRQSKVAPAQAGDVPDPSDVLASFNGTQCGFCSVGMVMTMNQQLVSIPVAGAPPPSERDIEDLFAGNICRCTGYRPILCGFKSAYAASGNVDELAQTPALVQDESVGYANGFVRSPHVDVIDYKIPPHEGLQKAAPMSLMSLKGPPAPSAHNWPTPPTSWSDLVAQLQSNKLPQPVKLVVGNTSYGVFPSLEWQGVGSFLDMRSLPGVSEISYLPLSYALVPGADKEVVARLEKVQKAFTKAKEELGSKVIFGSWLELGAAVTIQQLMDYLSGSLPMCSQLARRLLKHWKRVAGHQVRNAGSLVGSLCMARFWNFASDTWLLLEALGVFITLTDLRTGIDLIMQLDCFRNLNHVPFVIKNIWIPLVEDSSVQPAANSWFSSYRVAQRLQNAHPLVNFAGSWDGTGLPILVWGNILPAPQDPAQRPVPKVSGTGHYRLSHKLCKTILVAAQNQWANNGLASVQHSVAAELNSVVGSWPAPPAYSEQGDPSIRVQIATNLLLKFLVQAMGAPAAADSSSTIYEQRTATASAGSQKFLVNRSEEPVSEPMVKSSAKEQTRGQTQYASSFRPPNCYHATFVTSWASCGVIAKDSYGAPSLSDAVAWVNAQYGMDLDVAEFTLVDPTDEQFAASNLINGANYIYAPQNYPAPKVSLAWPTAPIFQNTPC
jgi:xanthine dehydrogenase/oxidase